MSTWKYSDPLVTQKIACDDCHGTLVHDDEPSDVSLYTREGTQFAQHFAKVCPNRWCRKRFYYGYSVKCVEKVIYGFIFLMIDRIILNGLLVHSS